MASSRPRSALAAGKPKRGTVKLAAVYSGAEVTISYPIDGAGLDAHRIRQKAEEQGLITPETASASLSCTSSSSRRVLDGEGGYRTPAVAWAWM